MCAVPFSSLDTLQRFWQLGPIHPSRRPRRTFELSVRLSRMSSLQLLNMAMRRRNVSSVLVVLVLTATAVQAGWFDGKSKVADQQAPAVGFSHIGLQRALGVSSFTLQLKVRVPPCCCACAFTSSFFRPYC